MTQFPSIKYGPSSPAPLSTPFTNATPGISFLLKIPEQHVKYVDTAL